MSFFKDHQKILEENYPGINEQIFLRELKDINLETIKEDLFKGKPLNYINNKKYFFNREFYVDERVLIPRNETEVLVEEALKTIKAKDRVLDLCCGSGNIGLALLEEIKDINLSLADLSLDALKVAEFNCHDDSVAIIQSDLYQNIDGEFDLIVSNPPYISTRDIKGVHKKVDEFEPHIALYIDESSYASWFERYFVETYHHLVSGGVFLMEGHEDKLIDQKFALEETGFKNVKMIKDLTGRFRFLKGYKK